MFYIWHLTVVPEHLWHLEHLVVLYHLEHLYLHPVLLHLENPQLLELHYHSVLLYLELLVNLVLLSALLDLEHLEHPVLEDLRHQEHL